jgi:hypothetical protein
MKIRVTGYSHTYPIGSSGHFEKAWIEAEFDSDDDIQCNLQFLKQQVEQFHKETNQSKLSVTTVKTIDKVFSEITESDIEKATEKASTQRERAAQNIINQISSCTDAYILRSAYEKLAKNYPEIQSAYNQKLKELTV